MNTTSWTEKLALTIIGLLLLPLTARADFSWSYLRNFLPPTAWTFVSGQFAGTNLTDLVGYDNRNGSIWVGRNTGFSFAWSQVGFVQPAGGWSFVAGKFGGTGLTDLVGYYSGNGSVWVGLNSGGTKFTWKQVKIVAPAKWWIFFAGQFAGTTLDDLVGYYLGNGSIWVATNTGTTFVWKQVDLLGESGDRRLVAGQFGGTGLADLAAIDNDPSHGLRGRVMIGRNEGGSSFAWKQVATLASDPWDFNSGQFGGNTLTDLVATNLFPPFFSLIGTNKGSALAWGSGIPPTYPSRYALVVGQFAGNSLADLVQYRDNGELWLGVNTAGVK